MNWLTAEVTEFLSPPWAEIVLTLTAVACGMIVGAERERKEKSAGLRTLALVTLGAAVFSMLSVAVAGARGDPGRIAAQIVTGVGFLGAGAILRGHLGVTGLTTAATIWAMAAVGMVVGMGYAVAGLALSLLVLFVLSGASLLERRYVGPCRWGRAEVVFDPAGGKTTVRIDDILDAYLIPAGARESEAAREGMLRVRFPYCQAHKHHREFLARIAVLPEVREIRH